MLLDGVPPHKHPGGQVVKGIQPWFPRMNLQLLLEQGAAVGREVVVVGAAVVVAEQSQTLVPSQHWFGPVVVVGPAVGHAGVVPKAPPGTHSVRTHSPATVAQKFGGTQPQGGGVVVPWGFVVVALTVVVTGAPVVVVFDKSWSNKYRQAERKLHVSQSSPGTHSDSQYHIRSPLNSKGSG